MADRQADPVRQKFASSTRAGLIENITTEMMTWIRIDPETIREIVDRELAEPGTTSRRAEQVRKYAAMNWTRVSPHTASGPRRS
jgi:hypothetical protein